MVLSRQTEFIDEFEQFADVAVVLDHAVGVFVVALCRFSFFTWVRK